MTAIVLTCHAAREAISARIDGEDPGVAETTLDRHLAACGACRTWEEAAIDVGRRLRVQPAATVPDLTDRILTATGSPGPGIRRGLLAAVAAVQITLGILQFAIEGFGHGGHLHGEWARHLFDEGAAWNLAVGVGMAWTAWFPRHARGFAAPLATFVAVLMAISIRDLVADAVPVARVVSHLPLLVGLGLVWAVDGDHRRPRPGLSRTVAHPERIERPPVRRIRRSG